jgi:hypothetical protein
MRHGTTARLSHSYSQQNDQNREIVVSGSGIILVGVEISAWELTPCGVIGRFVCGMMWVEKSVRFGIGREAWALVMIGWRAEKPSGGCMEGGAAEAVL